MEETAAKHDLMSDITLINPSEFRISDGIIFIGLDHVKKACEIEPDNIELKKSLLFYYDMVPGEKGTYLSREEYNKISDEIQDFGK